MYRAAGRTGFRRRYGRNVTDDDRPQLTGVHHFSVTVPDVETSATWYENVFGMTRIPVTFPHHEREDTGYAVLVMDPASGVVIGLHHNTANEGEPFDEKRTGLDHIAFSVPSRADLDRWVARLDDLGIAHSGVRDVTEPIPFATLVLRDPDNIQLELYADA
jgi:glyoxylase I family protein